LDANGNRFVSDLHKFPLPLFSVTNAAPVLATVGSQLWMAYKSSNDNSLIYMNLGDLNGGGDPVVGAPVAVPNASSWNAPSLCFTDTRGAYIAWTAADYTLQVYSIGGHGFPFNTGAAKNQDRMSFPNQTSTQGVSLAYVYDHMYLSWIGSGNGQINIYNEASWQSDSNTDISTLGDTSPWRVGICGIPDVTGKKWTVDLTWAGVGNNSVNVQGGAISDAFVANFRKKLKPYTGKQNSSL
jgi:hypothetical protein